MNRRKFMQFAFVVPIVGIIGGRTVAKLRHYPLDELLYYFKRLPPAKLRSSGQWSVTMVLQHLAQSIRYSRVGYPQLESALYQYTMGILAFNTMAATGTMDHALNEPIPGAPAFVTDLPNDIALTDLIHELEIFIDWQGDLAPHYAYGKLSKRQYYTAHYLHIQAHLTEISYN